MTAKCDGCVCWIFFGPFAKNVLKGIRAVLRSRNKSLEPGATSRVSTISSGNSKSISLFTCCGWNLLVVIVKCKKSFSFISLEFSNWFQCEPQSCPNDLHSHVHVIEIRRADQVLQIWGCGSWQRTIADLLHKARNAMSIKWNLPGRVVTMGQGPSDRFSGIAWHHLQSCIMPEALKWLPRLWAAGQCAHLIKNATFDARQPWKSALLFASSKSQANKHVCESLKQFPSWTNCFMKPSVFMMSRCLILPWESNPSTTCRMAKHRAFPAWQILCVSCKTPDWNLDLGCGIGLIFHPNQFVVTKVKCLGT